MALSKTQAATPMAIPGLVPARKFGRHDEQVSSLALGGHALGTTQSVEDATRLAHAALDLGITFWDNAWDYHDGRSEEWMGKALKGKRDKVFLMTKVCTHGKGRDAAMRMLDQSLSRLGVDHLDLWQVHAVASLEQVESAKSLDGVLEALDLAKKQGKVRYTGFTGHTNPKVHLAMLATDYPFDAVQMPLSVFDGNNDGFQKNVLPELLRRKIAPIAMKSLCGNAKPLRDGVVTVEEALRYTLSLPIATLVNGANTIEQLTENAGIAAGFTPMSKEQIASFEAQCRPHTNYEMYRRWM